MQSTTQRYLSIYDHTTSQNVGIPLRSISAKICIIHPSSHSPHHFQLTIHRTSPNPPGTLPWSVHTSAARDRQVWDSDKHTRRQCVGGGGGGGRPGGAGVSGNLDRCAGSPPPRGRRRGGGWEERASSETEKFARSGEWLRKMR